MQEIIDQVLTYLKGVWVRKWYVILVAWMVCIIGWPVVLKMPSIYESKAQVHVDTQSLLKPILRGLTLQTNPDQEVQLMVRTLLIRPNLEKIARLTDLDLKATTPAQFDAIIGGLRGKIKIRSSRAGRQNLYTFSYTHSDPVQAKNIIQATLTTLVENTLGDKREDSDTATSFLDQQISDYEVRLVEAENRLKEFKRRNVGLAPGSQGSYYKRLEATKAELNSVELEYKEASIRYRSLLNQLTQEEVRSRSLSAKQVKSEIPTSYDSRIEDLERQLDQLKLKFTDKHPDIKETQRVIASLKERQSEERNNKYIDILNQGTQQTQIYQDLKFATAEAEAQMRSLSARATDHQARVKDLEEKVHTIPEIEAELVALNRDYKITQDKYNTLLERRESVRLSQKADVSADSFQFRVIEPPLVPSKPSGPNRILFLTAVTLFGLGAGVALAFLISQLRPIFFNTKQLNLVTGLPVFGSVTKLHSPEIIRRTRRNGILFVLASALLIGTYAGLLGIQLNPVLHDQLANNLPDIHNIVLPYIQPILDKF